MSTAFTASVIAFNWPSPEDRDYFKVEARVDGNGFAKATPPVVSKIYNETSTLVARPDPDNEFIGWTYEGYFYWEEGSDDKSDTIVIIPFSDVIFTAHFRYKRASEDSTVVTEESSGPVESEEKPPKSEPKTPGKKTNRAPLKDTSKKSPKTGSGIEAIIPEMSAVIMISAATVVVTGKRYFSSKPKRTEKHKQ